MLLRAVVMMVAVASMLGTASPAGAGSSDDCAQRVIRDWYSGGQVDGIYPLPCYRAAIRVLPDDVLQYSDALANAGKKGAAEGDGDGGGAGCHPGDSGASGAPGGVDRAAESADAEGEEITRFPTPAARRAHPPVRLATGPVEKASAPGIPYPLIALGGAARERRRGGPRAFAGADADARATGTIQGMSSHRNFCYLQEFQCCPIRVLACPVRPQDAPLRDTDGE